MTQTQPTVYDDDVLTLVTWNRDGCQYVACGGVKPGLLDANDLSESCGPARVTMHAACWKHYDAAWKVLYKEQHDAFVDAMTQRRECSTMP